ncbi:hypothetical protein P171DRAFT_341977, partial [Karstenula rhodostoma CBS 690.94]
MPVTFSSVGDIIAVCILVKDCVDALNEPRGSAAEYQAVVRELCILEKALLKVGILSSTHATTPELIRMKNDVSRFRAEVVAYSISIDQLLAAATMLVLDPYSAHTIKAQSEKITNALVKQDKTLRDMQARLSEVDKCVSAGNSLLLKIAKVARTDWLMHLGQELKA